MSQARPKVFIGSSAEGLSVAKALQVNLDRCAEVKLWNQGVFGLSQFPLESLVDMLASVDFATLVLTPDDLALSRSKLSPSPRDNVIFELGFFVGSIGRDRCFIVYDRTSDLKLPSDLSNITAATYEPHGSGELQPALGAAATQIESAICKLGSRRKVPDDVYIDTNTQYRVIADLLEPPALQFFILMHQNGVFLRREEWAIIGIPQEYFLGEKRGMGHGYFRVNDLCRRLADAGLLQQDLRGNVSLTERGRMFASWLVAEGYKAEYFWSDYGTWGERPEEFKRMTSEEQDTKK